MRLVGRQTGGLEKFLQDTAPKEVQKIFKNEVKSAARIIVKQTRGDIDRYLSDTRSKNQFRYSDKQWIDGGPGRLKRSIGVKSISKRKGGGYIVVVGARLKGSFKGHHENVIEQGSWQSLWRPHPRTGTSGIMPAFELMGGVWKKVGKIVQARIYRRSSAAIRRLGFMARARNK